MGDRSFRKEENGVRFETEDLIERLCFLKERRQSISPAVTCKGVKHLSVCFLVVCHKLEGRVKGRKEIAEKQSCLVLVEFSDFGILS